VFMVKKNKPDRHGFVYSTDPDFHFEESGNAVETPGPEQQLLLVKTDTKHRAGKVVTLVKGFTGKAEDLEMLGKKIKSFCGTGGSVKDGEIIIQGNQVEKVMQWLGKNGYGKARKQ